MTTDQTQESTDQETEEKPTSTAENALDQVVGEQTEKGEESIFQSKAKIQSEGAVIDEETGVSQTPEEQHKSGKVLKTLGTLLLGSLVAL